MTDEEKNILNDFAELNQADFETQLVFMIGREIYSDKRISEFTENMLKLKESYSPDFIIRMLAFMPAYTVIKEDWEQWNRRKGGMKTAELYGDIHEQARKNWESLPDSGKRGNKTKFVKDTAEKFNVSERQVWDWFKAWGY